MKFSAVILAGGQSSRMGSDKAFLPVSGQPLLERQIQLVRAVGADEIFISGRADADYTAFAGVVLKDRFPAAGPLAGIESALAVTANSLLLVLAVDMAGMTEACLRWLLSQCAEHRGVVPSVGGFVEPLAAIYPRAAHALVLALLRSAGPEAGTPGARQLAEQCLANGLARQVEVGADQAKCFANWNTPGDVSSVHSCPKSKDGRS